MTPDQLDAIKLAVQTACHTDTDPSLVNWAEEGAPVFGEPKVDLQIRDLRETDVRECEVPSGDPPVAVHTISSIEECMLQVSVETSEFKQSPGAIYLASTLRQRFREYAVRAALEAARIKVRGGIGPVVSVPTFDDATERRVSKYVFEVPLRSEHFLTDPDGGEMFTTVRVDGELEGAADPITVEIEESA